MPDRDEHVTAGRMRRTMPLAGFTARAAGGRIVAGLRERAAALGGTVNFSAADDAAARERGGRLQVELPLKEAE